MPPWTRAALVCLLVALAVGLSFALVSMYLRRQRRVRTRSLARVPSATPPPAVPMTLKVRSVLAAQRRTEMGTGSGGLAVATTPFPATAPATGRMGCPTCRRDYEAGVRFCSFDGRRLVVASEVPALSRVPGTVCPRCRRALEAGIGTCPHDGEEVMALPLWEATYGRKERAVTGVLGKICPQCVGRYDLAMSFCGRDGAELMTIN